MLIQLTRRGTEASRMGGFVGLTRVLVLIVVAFMFFGAKWLPVLGQGLGRGTREFKTAVSEDDPAPSNKAG